ncbi:MAG: BamA/TamA family outer membrane protein [Caenispirillum sp.]|nr:BamA/TamA family outer membrane protein [Caenispirillum sp.]
MAALLAAARAMAQPVLPPSADPGAIQQRQIEEERRRREAERERYKPSEPIRRDALERPAVEPAPDAVRFLVREIRFTPSEILTPAELDAIAAEFRGKELTLADLRRLTERINALYKAKGVVTATAVIPPQDVSAGIVHIRLIEGRVGRVNIEGNATTRTVYIADRLRLEPNDLVDLGRLEKNLRRFNRTNDVQLRAGLKPGEAFGTTDIEITASEPPRHELRLTLDNAGNPSTGEWRKGVSYLNRSVLGYRDDFSLSLTRADGQDSRAIAYGFPINTWGGRLNLAYYQDKIAIKHGALESLNITGASRASVLSLRQPVWVEEHYQLDVLGGGKKRRSTNWIDGVFLQRTDTDDLNLGVEMQVFDAKSLGSASFTRHAGKAAIADDRRDHVIDRGVLRYNRELGNGLSFRGNLAWQATREKNLPSSELFSIGGEGSVRAYSPGTFAGDRGYAVNLELHHPLLKTAWDSREFAATGFFFADRGIVKPFRPPNSTLPSSERLNSAGWGIHASLGRHVYSRITFAWGSREVPQSPRHRGVHFLLVASLF